MEIPPARVRVSPAVASSRYGDRLVSGDAASGAAAHGSKPMAPEAPVYCGSTEQLSSVADASIDVAFSVGTLEHILDKGRMVANAFRALRPGGRFVCFTPNGHYLWYRWLAPLSGLEQTSVHRLILVAPPIASPPLYGRLSRPRVQLLDVHFPRRYASAACRTARCPGPLRKDRRSGPPARWAGSMRAEV